MLLVGCGKEPPKVRRINAVETKNATVVVVHSVAEIGRQWVGKPWIAHIATGDLDQDGWQDLLVCEARENQLGWIRQVESGRFEERTLEVETSAPVHAQMVGLIGMEMWTSQSFAWEKCFRTMIASGRW
ncbi:MAG: VCBS repeat-containing protein [Candidatus Synoicihabitans palmerolidicus]|nr:VCBS repeat-containing protein [Candidatus Synoicihabitans palmerolidicus]